MSLLPDNELGVHQQICLRVERQWARSSSQNTTMDSWPFLYSAEPTVPRMRLCPKRAHQSPALNRLQRETLRDQSARFQPDRRALVAKLQVLPRQLVRSGGCSCADEPSPPSPE